MGNDVNNESSQYPSVELAYEFVKPSYDWLINRIEIANNKMHNLLTFTVSITAAIPLFAKAIFSEIDFGSNLFYVSIAFFAAIVIIGAIGERMGSVILMYPKFMYNNLLHHSNYEFKKIVLFWAGEHFDANKKLIKIKGILLDIMTGCLLCEVIFIIIWITV